MKWWQGQEWGESAAGSTGNGMGQEWGELVVGPTGNGVSQQWDQMASVGPTGHWSESAGGPTDSRMTRQRNR